MRKHIQGMMISSSPMVIKLCLNLLLNKILAIYIGVSGYSYIFQLQNLVTVYATLSNGAMGTGLIKHTASSNNINEKNKYISTASFVSIILVIAIAIISLVFSDNLSIFLFNDAKFSIFVLICGAFSPLYALSAISIAVITGDGNYRAVSKLNVGGAILSFIVSVALVYLYGLTGALLSTIVSLIGPYLLFVFFGKELHFKYLDKTKLSRECFTSLGKFSLMGISSAILIPLSQTIIRNGLIDDYGVNISSQWDAAYRVSIIFILLCTSICTIYLVPQYSKESNKKKLLSLMLVSFIFFILVSFSYATVIFFWGDLIVELLFTSEFVNTSAFLQYQIFGDFLKCIGLAFSWLLISKSKYKSLIISEIIFSLSWIIVNNELAPSIYNASISYIMASGAQLSFVLFMSVLYIKGLEDE